MQKASTLYTDQKGVLGEQLVEFWHACPVGKFNLINQSHSAGGVPPNPDCGAPTEKQCLAQVEFEGFPGAQVDRPRDVIEGTIAGPGSYRGRDGTFAVFQIKAKYLRQGSGTEGGWCCLPQAPVSNVALKIAKK
jgi:hypothetical protein